MEYKYFEDDDAMSHFSENDVYESSSESDSGSSEDTDENQPGPSENIDEHMHYYAGEYDPDGFDNIPTKPLGVMKPFQLISIHRLLQKVMRYAGKSSENETLNKILASEGFINYKLIPYGFAEKHLDLVERFENIRIALVDQLEAVELAKMIYATYMKETYTKRLSSCYNYAVCLEKNRNIKEALGMFKNLYSDLSKIKTLTTTNSEGFVEIKMDTIDLETIPNRLAV